MYLIEGGLDFPLDKTIHGIKISTLLGSIVNTQFRDSIKLYKTVSIKETICFIEKLQQSFCKDLNSYFKSLVKLDDSGYSCTLKKKKKDNFTPKVWFINQLSSIPQVTDKISTEIIKQYPSVKHLILKYESIQNEDERLNMLSDITYPIKNDKQRRVGVKISSRIYNMFYDKNII